MEIEYWVNEEGVFNPKVCKLVMLGLGNWCSSGPFQVWEDRRGLDQNCKRFICSVSL